MPVFLTALIAAPYEIHTGLTENGIRFRFRRVISTGQAARFVTHMFDMRFRKTGIEHRCIKVNQPLFQWSGAMQEPFGRGDRRPTLAL